MGSTLGINIETAEMECPLPQATQKRLMVNVTPPVSVLPEKTMAPMLEFKENGVMLRPEGDIRSVGVAQKMSFSMWID